ncbi:CobW family GTP-binding protein [Paenibacillus sp. GCM10023252]|uniref:CobW family GTP-binding protein n=1 Tax=Paenibacillus sp. GCM10023252 TaxID=3252649 RepID=UPI003624313E
MRIPVIVLSGFLGSGKTTLLLRLLQESRARGLKPGVIMNELGSRDVDGHILSQFSDTSIEKMLDGCVCCSRKSELAGSIAALVKQQPDFIVIELTGVANPEEIADALTEPSILGQVSMKQIVTVLDSEHVLLYNSIFEADLALVRTLRRQIETADLLIVNKTDLVTETKLNKIDKAIRKQNDKAGIIHTTFSGVDLDLMLSGVKKRAGQEPAIVPISRPFRMTTAVPKSSLTSENQTKNDAHESPSFTRVQTMTLTISSHPLPSRKQIDRLLSKFKHALLRAKGYIRLNEHTQQAALMQHAGGRTSWSPSEYTGEPYMVFIGIDLDEQAIRAEWERRVV